MTIWQIVTVVCVVVQVIAMFIARADHRRSKREIDESTQKLVQAAEKLIAAGKEVKAIIDEAPQLVEKAMDEHLEKRTGGNGFLSKGGTG